MNELADSNPAPRSRYEKRNSEVDHLISRSPAGLQHRIEIELDRQSPPTSDLRWSVRSSLLLIVGVGIVFWAVVLWLFFH